MNIPPIHSAEDLTPHWYDDSEEFNAVKTEINALFENLSGEIGKAWGNQYVSTANANGIAAFEALFEITPTADEGLELRRERVLNRFQLTLPFSLPVLKSQLDLIIGAGKWDLTVNYNERNLTIETYTTTQSWYQELQVTLVKMLPANMGFINRVLLPQGVYANELVNYIKAHYYTIQGIWPVGLAPFREWTGQYNYKLGTWHLGSSSLPFATFMSDVDMGQWNYFLGQSVFGTWELGLKPFGTQETEVVKLAAENSLTDVFFEHHAAFTVEDIYGVRLNGSSTLVTTFTTKESQENTVYLEYALPQRTGDSVNRIELVDKDGNALSEIDCYIPRTTAVIIKHTIKFEQGVYSNG